MMMMMITLRNHERRLQATLLEQRGYTCEVPQMDPFDKEIMQFFEVVDKIYCPGFDWVACHMDFFVRDPPCGVTDAEGTRYPRRQRVAGEVAGKGNACTARHYFGSLGRAVEAATCVVESVII
ncbi:unnamed protein product [Plutella xylostella]|uniref:(diamondback moth) hypothetical protein n=1 Tax=Plutella xylostella TaxID=51655 RepID=A0A8S4EM16_PLUXY|nr:unnamed protein product [Plutella xylostella]